MAGGEPCAMAKSAGTIFFQLKRLLRYSRGMNMTPIWVSSRQMVLHVLTGSPAAEKSNVDGMPVVV
jgi:hypothetical protein